MSAIMNPIDFMVLITANWANPNGGPLSGNIPRRMGNGYGYMAGDCLRFKLRKRLHQMGEPILNLPSSILEDGYKSDAERIDKTIGERATFETEDDYKWSICQTWLDARTIGVVAPNKLTGKEKELENVSVGIAGPFTIDDAVSVSPIDIVGTQITKSTNSLPGDKKGKDTMGMRYCVPFGLYVARGALMPQLAEKTGFTEEDAEKIKKALRTLFVNDGSSARPEGSMSVFKLYWWEHNRKSRQYPPFTIHQSVHIDLKPEVKTPQSIEDYDISVDALPRLKMLEIEGI